MNKHTLNYHTRLHDWYRRHVIIQREQHQGSDTDPLPSPVPGCGTLTKDKIHFISDWCSDVNKTFSKLHRKETSSNNWLPAHGAARSRGDLVRRRVQPSRQSLEIILPLTDTKQRRTNVKLRELLQPENTKVRISHTEDVRGNETINRKSIQPSKNSRDIDFCVINSKWGFAGTKDFPRISHDLLNARSNVLSFKQSGGSLSGQNMNCAGNDIPKTSTSVEEHVKNVTPGHVSGRAKARHEALSKSADRLQELQLTIHKGKKNSTGAQESLKLKSQDLFCNIKNNNSALDAKKEVKSEMPVMRGKLSERSLDSQSSLSSKTCENYVRHININIHPKLGQKNETSPQNGLDQTKLPKSVIVNENDLNTKTTIKEKDTGKSECTAGHDSVLQHTSENVSINHGQLNQSDYVINSSNNHGSGKHFTIGNNDGNYRDKESQLSVKEQCHGDSEPVSEEEKNDDIMCNNTALDIDLQNGYQGEVDVTLCGAVDQKGGHETLVTTSQSQQDSHVPEMNSISNISLSNTLINVLTIDDCKISMRYNLKKVTFLCSETLLVITRRFLKIIHYLL